MARIKAIADALIGADKTKYGAEYDKHLFEQYKLYVEMADRVSARRALGARRT